MIITTASYPNTKTLGNFIAFLVESQDHFLFNFWSHRSRTELYYRTEVTSFATFYILLLWINKILERYCFNIESAMNFKIHENHESHDLILLRIFSEDWLRLDVNFLKPGCNKWYNSISTANTLLWKSMFFIKTILQVVNYNYNFTLFKMKLFFVPKNYPKDLNAIFTFILVMWQEMYLY